MRFFMAVLIWAAFSIPAFAQPCYTREAVSNRLLQANPEASVVITARGRPLVKLLAVFNQTPPVTTTLGPTEVGYADIWSKPRSSQALVVFYKAGCFVAYMRTQVQRLKPIFPKADFRTART